MMWVGDDGVEDPVVCEVEVGGFDAGEVAGGAGCAGVQVPGAAVCHGPQAEVSGVGELDHAVAGGVWPDVVLHLAVFGAVVLGLEFGGQVIALDEEAVFVCPVDEEGLLHAGGWGCMVSSAVAEGVVGVERQIACLIRGVKRACRAGGAAKEGADDAVEGPVLRLSFFGATAVAGGDEEGLIRSGVRARVCRMWRTGSLWYLEARRIF